MFPIEIMKQVLLFEYASGGGIEQTDEFSFLMSEGFGMLSKLITDFSQLGLEIHTLIDTKVLQKFHISHQEILKVHKLHYEVITAKAEIFSKISDILPKCDYILIIAPEYSNILYDIIYFVEHRIKSHQILLNLSSKAVAIFTDKLKTESYLSSKGCSVPKSIKLSELRFAHLPCEQEFIVKPIDGVGASDTYCLRPNCNDDMKTLILNISQKSLHRFLIQEKFDGNSLSAFIAAKNGQITYFTINSQSISYLQKTQQITQLEYVGGSTPYEDLSLDVFHAIKQVASTICDQFQMTGFMGIDFIYNDKMNSYVILDINPRVTTPYIAISELFRENNSNILQCLFTGEFRGKIRGKKSFVKTSENTITLK